METVCRESKCFLNPCEKIDSTKMAAIFKLDLAEYELTRGGETIKLERLPMQLLMLLVERSGRLVTRTEIIRRRLCSTVFE